MACRQGFTFEHSSHIMWQINQFKNSSVLVLRSVVENVVWLDLQIKLHYTSINLNWFCGCIALIRIENAAYRELYIILRKKWTNIAIVLFSYHSKKQKRWSFFVTIIIDANEEEIKQSWQLYISVSPAVVFTVGRAWECGASGRSLQ